MRIIMFFAAAVVMISSQVHAGGDPVAGKAKVGKCVACHGKDGVSKNPDAPNLAGQVETYLVRSFMAYKTGERTNPMMTVMAKTVEQPDIDNLAAYYASIKITVEKPQ